MSKKNTGKNVAKITDMLGLLVRVSPRTIPEIIELTDMNRQTVRTWLKHLCQEGLVRRDVIKQSTGGMIALYYWSPPTCTPQD